MLQIDWIFILSKINKVGHMILSVESAFYMLKKKLLYYRDIPESHGKAE